MELLNAESVFGGGVKKALNADMRKKTGGERRKCEAEYIFYRGKKEVSFMLF